ncbi:MAG TPA: thiamine pyrophosphate-dependent enzyme, partial [Kineosporiaceae bacterium]|nr:thiamine pyrophosphate-dependent enzyme [Kineosporiaceae bacterium]
MTQLGSMGGDTAADFAAPAGGGETRAPVPYELGDVPGPLGRDELRVLDAWWRAANYLAVGQIYLMNNPLLREPLRAEHVKPRLLGHFGTVPGLNLVYAHASRFVRERDLDAVFVAGPGHGGPGPNACAWLEGTYSELYSFVPRDAEGMQTLFHRFSFPGGVPSHCAPETPGSFHEGGELGYALLHAFGAAFDNPDLVVFAVVGDGEANEGTIWEALLFAAHYELSNLVVIVDENGYQAMGSTREVMRLGRIADKLSAFGLETREVDGHDEAALEAALDELVRHPGPGPRGLVARTVKGKGVSFMEG